MKPSELILHCFIANFQDKKTDVNLIDKVMRIIKSKDY
jgi:hypothetical protein